MFLFWTALSLVHTALLSKRKRAVFDGRLTVAIGSNVPEAFLLRADEVTE